MDNFSKTMNKLHVRLENIKRHADSLDDQLINVDVTGDMKARRDLRKVGREADRVGRKNVMILVRTNANNALQSFRKDMGKIATLSRDIGEIIGRTLTSALVTASTTGVASMGALAGVIGNLGPMVGALAGGTFGLATALGVAGVAAAGFGAVAFPSIRKVFEANSELKDLQEQLANADSGEERAEILAEMAAITDDLSSSQRKALASIGSLSDTFGKLSKSVEPESMYVFTQSLGILESLMVRLTPMIESVAKVAVRLTDSLKFNVDSKDFSAFIDFLNSSAAPIMDEIFKGLGNFTMGIVNMMTAFGPASQVIASGFNDMGRRFREWAAGLSESERFNAFIDYVLKEGPKVLSIFGGITTGLVDMFAAFGPLASEMMDGLLEMIEGFKEWARTLDENPAFQEFTEWVRSHGPELVDFFGRLRELLINLGIGFAQVSETVTPFLTNLMEMANSFMENNRWAGQLFAWLVTLGGAAMNTGIIFRILKFVFDTVKGAIAPIASRVGPHLLRFFQWLGSMISTYVIPWLSRLWQWFLRGLPTLTRLGAFFVRFITGPIGWIVQAIIALGIIVYKNWDSIWSWTKDLWGKTKKWIVEKVEQISETANKVKEFVDRVIRHFKELWNGIKERMSDIKEAITDGWKKAQSFLEDIDLWQIGRDIINGLVRGIQSVDLKSVVSGIASKLPSWIKGPLRIASPSKVTAELGGFVGEGLAVGMEGSMRMIRKASDRMAVAAIPSRNNLQFQGVDSNTAPNRWGNTSRYIDDERYYDENRRQVIEVPVYLNGREIAKASTEDVTRIQQREDRRDRSFRG